MCRCFATLLFVILAAAAGCDFIEPEVAVTNELEDSTFMADISFGGCHWPDPLGPGETTSVCRAVPGRDHVRFVILRPCSHQCEVMGQPDPDYPEHYKEGPRWFPYRTVQTWDLSRGGFAHVTVAPDAIEQDFSAPSPFGH